MKISFSSKNNQYKSSQKINHIIIKPISKDLSDTEVSKYCTAIQDKNLLGTGYNGSVYSLGRDLVIKKSRKDALNNTNLSNETRKLRMLGFLNEPTNGLQRGIAEIKFLNGDSYLISTKMKGKSAYFYSNPLTKKNLISLMNILYTLDKGSDKLGRFMSYDLNGNNINFTPNSAGIFDFEYLSGEPLISALKKEAFEITDNNLNNPHLSDTSGMSSNVRSFEWATLHHYLMNSPKGEAKKIFVEYLKIKSSYHKKMSDYYIDLAKKEPFYKEEFLELAKRENIHSTVLAKPNNDIIKAETLKIQMAHFIFKASHYCNCKTEFFNPTQVARYNKSGIDYFETMKDLSSNDKDKIYYQDCLDTLKRWQKIQNPKKILIEMQKVRISKNCQETIDFLYRN